MTSENEQPLCIDLFCGLGGWTEGFLAEGWHCVGFDIEQHVYGEHRYPAHLVLQDVRTIHGKQFKDATVIVASSPCQEFSYRAMPWKRAKQLPPPLLGMELFAQAARIQREACDAAGRYIPMIQENVRGAQKYVGRARWHYGSYYLWGDVPALMPIPIKGHKNSGGSWFGIDGSGNRNARNNPRYAPEETGVKVGGFSWSDYGKEGYKAQAFNGNAERATKNTGGSWFAIGSPGQREVGRNPVNDAIKIGGDWFDDRTPGCHAMVSGKARKAAPARIAKIPFPLANYIARVYHPNHL